MGKKQQRESTINRHQLHIIAFHARIEQETQKEEHLHHVFNVHQFCPNTILTRKAILYRSCCVEEFSFRHRRKIGVYHCTRAASSTNTGFFCCHPSTAAHIRVSSVHTARLSFGYLFCVIRTKYQLEGKNHTAANDNSILPIRRRTVFFLSHRIYIIHI